MLSKILCLCSCLFILFSQQLHAQDRLTGRSFATRSMVIAQHGMACTSHPLATMTAIDILKKGGTAIDAAIAANAVLGVVDPEMCGIGGDLFAIVYDAKTNKLYGLNASGRSPYNLTLDEFKKRRLSYIPFDGPLSVSVPGCVDGWFELHRKFGKLPMKDVLAPAIRYASEGFPVSAVIANDWSNSAVNVTNQPGFGAVYLPGGRVPAKGEVFRNPSLAVTIERIAGDGR